jgi:hypothetical protein
VVDGETLLRIAAGEIEVAAEGIERGSTVPCCGLWRASVASVTRQTGPPGGECSAVAVASVSGRQEDMRKVLWGAALAAAAAASFATPAGAAVGDCRELLSYEGETPEPTGVTVCRQDAWFHASDQRLGNVSTTPSWSTTKPSDAIPTGGAVYGTMRLVDILEPGTTSTAPTFTGTYTGKLDNLAVTIYTTSLYTALGAANALVSRVFVDGEQVVNSGEDSDVEVSNTPVDEHTSSMSFAFTGLNDGLAGVGVANTATTKHDITVQFVNTYWGDSNFLMFYDSAEYPSGLVFNLETNPDDGSLPGYTEIPANE